ncbi:(Fe-S)-binding protein [Paenibacillus sp. GM2]|uniref:(Fe-S)-binding protein n=1 Tax=Paenibacillus sp. GM2 TaxID=1622070 RepID=UPI000839BCCC|nr:(Fe-S)-binding protein [Paenibacillus sp. GM2]
MSSPNPKKERDSSLLTLQQELTKQLDYNELMNCMRCGFCQPSCPTYQETGIEAASPRGRIALMKAVADGVMEPDESFRQQINLCLGCRACEPVCPSDVKYGQLLEQTKSVLFEQPFHSAKTKKMSGQTETAPGPGYSSKSDRPPNMKRLHKLVKPAFKSHHRMLSLSALLEKYQRSGLQRYAAKKKLLRFLPEHFQTLERILPQADSQGVVKRVKASLLPAKGERIGTVGMFRGCIMDVLFTETNVNTVNLLRESGYDVVIPEAQGCCGALFSHSGDLKTARQFARRNIQAFAEAKVDYIASNAGGCGAMLIEYDHLLKDDALWKPQAEHFSQQIKDISELLLRSERWNSLKSVGAGPDDQEFISQERPDHTPQDTVTYQDSCHLRNVMKAGRGPRQLLHLLPDLNYVELEGAEGCCGSAGIYNLMQSKMANDILDHKMDKVNETGASIILTSNPGCLLQMKIGVEREQAQDRLRVMHVVDYFAEKVEKVMK